MGDDQELADRHPKTATGQYFPVGSRKCKLRIGRILGATPGLWTKTRRRVQPHLGIGDRIDH